MLALKKITARYDATEDRLVLHAEAADGQQARLWCTQRLFNRLAKALVSMLDQELARSTPAARMGGQQLHAMEQGAAQAQLGQQVPVAASAQEPVSALLTSVDITRRGQRFELIFKSAVEGVASMLLSATELRQWLGIVHRLYGQAAWPTDHWPAWFKAAQSEVANPELAKSLH